MGDMTATATSFPAVGPLDPESFADDVVTLCGEQARDEARRLAVVLLEAWSEPHRRHHSVEHLASSLAVATETLERLGVDARTAALVRVALWFHDAVYDPTRPDNEARSAELAVRSLTLCGLGDEDGVELERLVMVTAGHRYDPDDVAAAVVVDADLAVLASDAGTYGGYVAGVRAEYAHVDDESWKLARPRVLSALLDGIDAVFVTCPDPKAARAAARANVSAEIAALS